MLGAPEGKSEGVCSGWFFFTPFAFCWDSEKKRGKGGEGLLEVEVKKKRRGFEHVEIEQEKWFGIKLLTRCYDPARRGSR